MRDPLPGRRFAGPAALTRVLRQWWPAGLTFARLATDADLRAHLRLVGLLWRDHLVTRESASSWPRKGRRLLRLGAVVRRLVRLLCLFPFFNVRRILALRTVVDSGFRRPRRPKE